MILFQSSFALLQHMSFIHSYIHSETGFESMRTICILFFSTKMTTNIEPEHGI